MTFCGNCGTQIDDGIKFCPSCGQAAEEAQPQAAAPQTSTTYIPPVIPAAPQPTDIRDAQDNKAMAVLAYILFFVPLLTGAHKTSPFAKYHTNQGTVLFIATIAWSIACRIVQAILSALFLHAATFGLWGIISMVLSLLWLVPTALCVMGILNASKGIMKPLPVIGSFTVIK